MTNEELGIWGETQACIWLVDQGHKIEARNFRFKKNECKPVHLVNGLNLSKKGIAFGYSRQYAFSK